MPLPTIGSLWVGPELSWLEQLCLKSFVDHGHEVVLYSYDTIKGVPEGITLADANDILPADKIIRHAKTGSPAYHADVFRLHMIQQTDYVWADTDAFCVQPWVFTGKHFHGWISDKVSQVNNGVLQLPKTSKTLKAMLEFTSDEYPIPPWLSDEKRDKLQTLKDRGDGVHVSLLPWGVWGPDALSWFLKSTGEIKYSKPGHVIYPVPFKSAGSVLNPKHIDYVRDFIKDDTLSIHFWGRRFRNVAAKWGGIAPEGCYVHELLRRHEIDPEGTRHMFKVKTPVHEGINPETIDFSMFDDKDLENIILQRSEIAKGGHLIRKYLDGNDEPLLTYARNNKDKVLKEAFQIAERECACFLEAADTIAPKRVVDIGCGYAFADLLLYRRYNCDIALIDIETSEDRHFHFAEKGAGYTSLQRARKFLEANGVPSDKITTLNPNTEDPVTLGEFDLAISLASCGFHYPVNTYETLFRDQMRPGGGIVLDIRKKSGGIKGMKEFGIVEILEKKRKYSTVIARIPDQQAR